MVVKPSAVTDSSLRDYIKGGAVILPEKDAWKKMGEDIKRVKAKCSPSFLIKYTGEFKSLSDLERGAVDALRTVATEKADKHINDIFEHCAKHCKENKLRKARAITDMKKFCDAAVQVAGGGCGDRP